MSGTATIRSLRALGALAHIDLGEAALQLAHELDVQKQAATELKRCENDVRQLGAAYERMARPGTPLNVGALGSLARQTLASKSVLSEAKDTAEESNQSVDARRQVVHRHQSRYESLGGFLTEARRQHAAEREKIADQEREDLFLIRRHVFAKGAT